MKLSKNNGREQRKQAKALHTNERSTTAAMLAVFGSALILTALAPTGSTMGTTVSLSIAAVVILSFYGFTWALVGEPRPRTLLATFSVFVLIWFGLSPVFSIRMGTFPAGSAYTNAQIASAYGIIIVGLLSYGLGYWFALNASKPKYNRPALRHRSTQWRRNLALTSAASAVLSIMIWLHFGGPAFSLATRNEVSDLLATGNRDAPFERSFSGGVPPQTAALLAVMRVPPVMLLLAIVATRAEWRRNGLVALVLLLGCTNLLVNSPFPNPRQWVGAIALALLLAIFQGPLGRRLVLVSLIAGILVVFPALNGLRTGAGLSNDGNSVPEALGTTLDFDAMSTTIDSVTAVEVAGTQRGTQIAGAVGFMVPRSLWDSKPLPSGDFIYYSSPTNRSPTTNMSVTLWSEGYIDFGAIGVALYLSALGGVSAFLDSRSDSDRNKLLNGVLIPMLAGFQFILLRGALLPLASSATAIALTYFGMTSIYFTKKPSEHSSVSVEPGGTRPADEELGTERTGTRSGPLQRYG